MLSVVTLVRNRNRMLHDFLRGWSEQSLDDLEIVVVNAGGEEDPRLVSASFPETTVRHVAIADELDSDRIAYSHARNAGADIAHGDRIVFCDADTIPAGDLAVRLHDGLAEVDALLTADVLYLPPDIDLSRPITELERVARRHPRRPTPPADHSLDLTLRHALVWGVCMAIRTATFHELGGFDEHYRGYAGEDTDLAQSVAQSGRPAGIVGGARVLHQHHDSFEPPLHQMEATLMNARTYRNKWGTWPMEGWLEQFEQLGLITWDGDDIVVDRQPTATEIEAHRCRLAAPFR